MKKMQNVEHCDNKKLDNKVCGSASVPTTSKATTAKHSSSGNSKNTMSAANESTATANNKFVNSNSSPAKSDMDLHGDQSQQPQQNPRFLDSSESDEESVSEVCCTNTNETHTHTNI